jgi:cysteinyl-tRNA synthetase
LSAIDGLGQEDLFYGYSHDNSATPESETQYLIHFLDLAKNTCQTKILVTDYCSDPVKMKDAITKNEQKEYLGFAADHRSLDDIPSYPPTILGENNTVVTHLQQTKNFLYLINPDNQYATAQDFVNAIKNTSYDVLIMDLFFDGKQYTKQQINDLKQKANGGQRLLIAYMSIGEAENYRYYWQSAWHNHPPSWLEKENPNWKGNYYLQYWNTQWQAIIYGNNNSYTQKILDAGFDGVYLDIIDAFERYE